MKKITLFVLLLLSLTGYGQEAFDAPDQVVWHAPTKTWFVSNLGGGISLKKDNYGWITRLDQSGKVITPQWVKEGLHAPSGMVCTTNKLYVCDRGKVLSINIETAKIEKEFILKDSEFVNDIALADNGDLYVSDFWANRIYRIVPSSGKSEVFMDIPNSPDGLYFDNNHLIIATWGKVTDRATFATSKKGNMLSVDLKTKKVTPIVKGVEEIGNLEGITSTGKGTYYVTDWASGKLLRVNKNGVTEMVTGLKNPTDPGYAQELNILAFPEHTGNRVLFMHVE